MENNLSRNKEQELIMISIYDALIYITSDMEFSLEKIVSSVYECSYSDVPLFSKEVIIKSLSNYNTIVPIYQDKMPKWKFDRINNISKAILLMAYAQNKLIKDKTDKSVIIDVSVRLAKKYLEDKDYKFINAILDNVL